MQDQLKMYSIQTNDEVQIQTYDDLREVYGFEYNMVELVISTEKPKGSLYSELQSDRVELEKICDLYASFFPTCPPKPVPFFPRNVLPSQSIKSKALFQEYSGAYTPQ